jgi:FkbM family methyltransferase
VATLKNRLKNAANHVLNPLGWDFDRHVRFGRELIVDIATLSRQRPLRTVFDVGAYNGETAQAFVKHFPEARIYSFEPFKESFDLLVASIRDCPRVEAINLGLSDAPGVSTLHLNRGPATNSLLPNATESALFQPPQFVGELGTEEIRLTTLDEFCANRQIDFIDLLKIDSQGFEMHVLRGARDALSTGRVGLLYCEINFVPLYDGQAKFQDIFEFLLGCGLHLAGFYELGWNQQRRLLCCEALFLHTEAVDKRFDGQAH